MFCNMCVLMVIILNYNACHMTFNSRCPIKMNDHIRPTYVEFHPQIVIIIKTCMCLRLFVFLLVSFQQGSGSQALLYFIMEAQRNVCFKRGIIWASWQGQWIGFCWRKKAPHNISKHLDNGLSPKENYVVKKNLINCSCKRHKCSPWMRNPNFKENYARPIHGPMECNPGAEQ